MRIYRAKINNIIFEFTEPQESTKGIIVLCDGLPSVPIRKELMIELANKKFVVVFPRYQGTWESDGEFLKDSPVNDIDEVVKYLGTRTIIELYANKNIEIPDLPIHILGSSFGGSVALALIDNKEISKIVALSPIVDFAKHNNEGAEEDLTRLGQFIKRAFGYGYRFKDEQWQKMLKGQIFNPPQSISQQNADRILIGYGQLDIQVDYKKIVQYAKDNNINEIIAESNEGHLSFSKLSDRILDKILSWLSEK